MTKMYPAREQYRSPQWYLFDTNGDIHTPTPSSEGTKVHPELIRGISSKNAIWQIETVQRENYPRTAGEQDSHCVEHQPSRTSGQPRMLLSCTAGRLPSAVFTPQTQSMSVPLLQQLPPLRQAQEPFSKETHWLRPAVTTTLGPSAILPPPGLLRWARA